MQALEMDVLKSYQHTVYYSLIDNPLDRNTVYLH